MTADQLPPRYEPIAVTDESTVVSEFSHEAATEVGYQSEAALENELIATLEGQAYERLLITSEDDLLLNLRKQLELLNGIEFTDAEWSRFFTSCVSGENEGIVEKTRRIQIDPIQVLERDDGTVKNVRLIDQKNIHNNRLQVINQYESEGARATRYDVTILVNGLPLVHIELKRRGVAIREAFNQINRYGRDSFWAGTGLFNYVQLFVISNGTHTKYYSNTTREHHIDEVKRRKSKKQSSHSFEFTSWWADASNKPIADLIGFTKTFFAKHTLLNILTRYCVFDVDENLLVMRPYQIVAAERILQRVTTSTNAKQLGKIAAGGYIWHTTGSGKTLTSFKAAQLASRMDEVDKVLFVVDRKDLDYQTMREYDRFEKGAANSSKSTRELAAHLSDPDRSIVITTIQKLSRFIEQNKGHDVYSGHIVLIFDECHRSQFGEMHTAITKAFKNYNLFGFTGTPIFPQNAASGGNVQLRTTEQAFGERLHTYTIVDAINDKNVLPFRVEYHNTIRTGDSVSEIEVEGIDTEEAMLAPARLRLIVDYILDHFDQKTKRNSTYRLGDKRVSGFNSLFATQSIKAARAYYEIFNQQQTERQKSDPTFKPLKVGMIFSFAPNEAEPDGILGEESFETDALDMGSRDFLDTVIEDYNRMFGTSYDTSADQFQNYYKDLSARLRNRELDLVIVVNMFLTGFDATTLNTLWVDKSLRQHGLIQAFSRTNRILNSVKAYGNIVCFRDLQQATDEALSLFGNKDAGGIVLLRPYGEYLEEYDAKLAELREVYPLGVSIVGEEAQKEFVALFGLILRLRNILTSFDEFAHEDVMSPRELQDYQSVYLDIHAEIRVQREAEKESILDDIEFEIELVKQVEVNVDYILMLVKRFIEAGEGGDEEVRAEISRAVDSSPSLRNKKDLVEAFVDSVSVNTDIEEGWRRFIEGKRAVELDALIADEKLDPEATRKFIEAAFRDGEVASSGTAITAVLPKVSRFSADGDYGAIKQRVVEKLRAFFERYVGLA